MSKAVALKEGKSGTYDTRENWPPYTYRDYPDIKPEAYHAFMEFLNTENKSGRLMELQPWISVCDSKCAFCYFPTTATSKVKIEPYLDLLKKELKMYAKTKYVKTSCFDEIVLGGGTPSVLAAEQMIDLIDFCKANFNINKEYFIKVTGSSKTLALPKIDKLAEYGVYQMDMGAQTFDDKLRKLLCLPDTAADVEKAIRHARKLGLCVCADLMYNLPGQTQGGEADFIIISSTVSDPDYVRIESDFLLNLNRVNVAISRMKKKLVIIASQSIFEFLPQDAKDYDKALLWKGIAQTVGFTADGNPEWSGSLSDFLGKPAQEVQVQIYVKSGQKKNN